MPRPKPLHRYPEEYYKLLRRANKNAVRLSFETISKAKSFRVEMYNFRKALREALKQNIDDAHLQVSVLFAENLTFSLDDTTLIIDRKTTTAAEKINEVL